MTGRFATETAVRRIDGARFAAEVHDGWDIGGHANGGYLLAIAGRAMSEAAGRPPLTVTAHFLRPVPPGPVDVDVDVVRRGGRLVTVRATVTRDGAPLLALLGSFGDQTPGGPMVMMESPLRLPPMDECAVPPEPTEGPMPTLMRNLRVRLRPGDEGFRRGAPSGRAEIHGWFGFADESPVDAIGLLFVADAFAPPVFNTELPVAWVPTVELTVHVRAVPAPGPLRCAFRSRFIHGGLLDEDGEIWDDDDVLVAQSRQISLIPRPSGTS